MLPPHLIGAPPPPPAAADPAPATLADLVAAHESACLREVQAVLARYQCTLRAAPVPIGADGEVWGIRWGVVYRPTEE